MPTRWCVINDKIITQNPVVLSEKYLKRDLNRKSKAIEFVPGEKVLTRRGRDSKFSYGGTIVRENGHGSWLVRHINGREQCVNQRFIRRCNANDSEWVDKEYDMCDDTNECEPPIVTPKRTYNLRSRTIECFKCTTT